MAGAPDEVIAQAEADQAQAVDEDFEIFEDNFAVFSMFCSLQSQWNYRTLPKDGGSIRSGLIWGSIEIALDYAIADKKIAKKDRTAVRNDLVMMELEALKVFSEQMQ